MYDRFDIVRAYYWFAALYHEGQWSPEYALFGRKALLAYKPAPMDNGPRRGIEEDENCRAILASILRRWRSGELKATQ